MSMPKGHKMSQGYATVAEGLDYRAISEIMTSQGFKMNHATARNVLLGAMRTIAEELLKSRGEDRLNEKVEFMARSPMFQSGIADVLGDIYTVGGSASQ
jgi:hypothetical protein